MVNLVADLVNVGKAYNCIVNQYKDCGCNNVLFQFISLDNVFNNSFVEQIKNISCFEYKNLEMRIICEDNKFVYIFTGIIIDKPKYDEKTTKFLNFIKENNITTRKEFVEKTIKQVEELSKKAHLVGGNRKRVLWEIKREYFKFAYESGAVKSVVKQLTNQEGYKLYLFNIYDIEMHQPVDQCSYINDENVRLVEDLYFHKTNNGESNYDESIEDILKAVTNEKLLKLAGLS
jgi:hypothetical protein